MGTLSTTALISIGMLIFTIIILGKRVYSSIIFNLIIFGLTYFFVSSQGITISSIPQFLFYNSLVAMAFNFCMMLVPGKIKYLIYKGFKIITILLIVAIVLLLFGYI